MAASKLAELTGPLWERSMPDTSERKHTIPPHVQATRMQRYSLYLLGVAFALIALNYPSLTMASVLWFAAGLCACGQAPRSLHDRVLGLAPASFLTST